MMIRLLILALLLAVPCLSLMSVEDNSEHDLDGMADGTIVLTLAYDCFSLVMVRAIVSTPLVIPLSSKFSSISLSGLLLLPRFHS